MPSGEVEARTSPALHTNGATPLLTRERERIGLGRVPAASGETLVIVALRRDVGSNSPLDWFGDTSIDP